MSYDLLLTERIREMVHHIPGIQEKKMFGGICFIIHGNMALGVHSTNMIVRVGPDLFQDALNQPHTRVFDLTGKPMFGWVFVDSAGVVSDNQLEQWVERGLNFALSLPAK